MRAVLIAIFAAAVVTLTPVSAAAQTECSSADIPDRFDVLEADVNAKQGLLVFRVDSLAGTRADGIMLLFGDDGAPELLRADAVLTIACADTDGDGVTGIVLIELAYTSVSTQETFHVTIVPETEVDETGHTTASIRVSGGGGEAQWGGRPIWVTDLSNPREPRS